jgi:hypothetical protein
MKNSFYILFKQIYDTKFSIRVGVQYSLKYKETGGHSKGGWKR